MTAAAAAPRPDADAAPVVEVEDLKVHFRSRDRTVHAVDGVSFALHSDEILGLVGETGCGKSVTARALIGLLPVPPAVVAGGRAVFRPAGRCLVCAGSGCAECNRTGGAVCRACDGAGCQECAGTGRPALDLLRATPQQLRSIRGLRIAMIFQDPGKALNPALNIRDQIAEVFYQHRSAELLDGLGTDVPALVRRAAHQESRLGERLLLRVPPLRGPNRRLQRRVDDLVAAALAEVQIPNPYKAMRSYPHELSGGMQQRAMIAQAIACDPDVLIADEPTTALDTTVQARILELILDLQRQRRTAVLYISHDLSLVRLVCDRVAVMYAGRVAETGDADEVFHHPRHPYTQALLAAIPAGGRRRAKLAAIEGTVPEFTQSTPCCRFHDRCPYAAAVCRTAQPVLRAGERHGVACFGYEPPEPWGVTEADMPRLGEPRSLA